MNIMLKGERKFFNNLNFLQISLEIHFDLLKILCRKKKHKNSERERENRHWKF